MPRKPQPLVIKPLLFRLPVTNLPPVLQLLLDWLCCNIV
jgi:hypothetical protein